MALDDIHAPIGGAAGPQHILDGDGWRVTLELLLQETGLNQTMASPSLFSGSDPVRQTGQEVYPVARDAARKTCGRVFG